MKVKQLKKFLEEMPEDAEVVIVHEQWNVKQIELKKDKKEVVIK